MKDASELDRDIQDIRRKGRVACTSIIAIATVVNVAIIATTAWTIATRTNDPPPSGDEAAYRRIVEAIEDHHEAITYRSQWTTQDHAIEKMLYERLLEIDRARDAREREVTEAARRIGATAATMTPGASKTEPH